MRQMAAEARSQPVDQSSDKPLNIRQRSDAEARSIVDSIRSSVLEGRLSAGDRLPPEKSLCEQYAASRHTVRKAMTMLEKQGFVVRNVGRGSFILDPRAGDAAVQKPAWDRANGKAWTLTELTEARMIIEPQLATMVVERAGVDDFAAMEDCIAAIGAAGDWPAFKEAKYAFHLAMVRAAGNEFLCVAFEQIIAARRQTAWSRHHSPSVEMDGTKAVCVAESRAILDALKRRDVTAAIEAVRQSLIRILVAINEL